MAASGLQRLSRNQSNPSVRIINYFYKAQNPLPTPWVLTQLPQNTKPIHQFPFFDRIRAEDIEGTRFSDSSFYPSFAFEFLLYPGSTIVPFRSEELDNVTADDEDPRTIRADSVKKKRKKKMNKHKLRKLRKRLRRKT